MPTTTEQQFDLAEAIATLEADEPLELALDGGGYVSFTRSVPFLTVYRGEPERERYALYAEEAAYGILPPTDLPTGFSDFLEGIFRFLTDRYGAVLLVEVRVDEERPEPFAKLHFPASAPSVIRESLTGHLAHLNESALLPSLRIETGPLAEGATSRRSEHAKVLTVGLTLGGFFLGEDGRPYPLVLRELRARLHTALRRSYFDFVRLQTNYNATHFHQLGNHRVSDLVWEIDRRLVDITSSFRFLMLVTAKNDHAAFEQFTADGYRREPTFQYRFLPIDPEALKRDLYNLPIDRVQDATLAYILRDKRDETFQMLDMLANRGNENFRYGSMQVFGGVSDELLSVATRLLAREVETTPGGQPETIDASTFLEQCRREFDYLTAQSSRVEPRARVREDFSGLMVSQGVLNVGHRLRVPRHRAAALIQHEIGTHVLTFWNGRAQPLSLLRSGTPGYEDLQEGLAVLSEWFVGGLTTARMRVLAARVVGIAHMLRGHSFVETFQLLHGEYGQPARSAFFTTARIYRGGGFTKDAVYLRGLVELLDYLRAGGELEPLFIGKLRLDYVPLLEELRERGILRPPPLTPRYFHEDRERGHPKLNRLRAGMTVFDLLDHP